MVVGRTANSARIPTSAEVFITSIYATLPPFKNGYTLTTTGAFCARCDVRAYAD